MTTKGRVDRAVTHSGGKVERIIAFMYDPLFLFKNRFKSKFDVEESLIERIKRDGDRPIITQAFFFDSNGPGVIVRGHNIAPSSTTFHFTWSDGDGNIQGGNFTANWTAPGQANNGFDEVWIPFNQSDLLSKFYLHVSATTESGRRSVESFSYQY